MRVHRTLRKHFRLIVLITLSIAILGLSMLTTELPTMLPFGTLELNLEGPGAEEAAVELNFENNSHTMECTLRPGEYTLYANTAFDLYLDGKRQCGGTDKCRIGVAAPARMQAVLKDAGLLPNGGFRIYLSNKTEMRFVILFGKDYEFVEMHNVLPRELHGEYLPEEAKLVLGTYGTKDGGTSDYMNFDVYSIDAKNMKENEKADWLNDFITVPLAIAFIMLLVSDLIDYVHAKVRKIS